MSTIYDGTFLDHLAEHIRYLSIVIDVQHIYPFANRSTDGWSGMEDVKGVHISKCRVINRVRQLNEVGRRH